jgi:hypothetical protein
MSSKSSDVCVCVSVCVCACSSLILYSAYELFSSNVVVIAMGAILRYIFIPDTTSNSLVIVNDDSFALSILNLNEGFGSSGVVWPRSIASRRVSTLPYLELN